jgi:2-C-methyl-D-erythritol 4-phosphate cytidylyltransferase
MGAPVKKQYLQLDGLPLLGHTLQAFDRYPGLDNIVLVVPEEDLETCQTDVLGQLSLNHAIQLVPGGQHRQESVLNGLDCLDIADGIVMIHDGVRPFVRSSLIGRCLTGVKATGACIPAIPATDTLKKVDSNGVIVDTLPRQAICLAQTPQTFSIDLIRRAHHDAAQKKIAATDDASVAELAGASVIVVPGDPDNIKITTPHDLVIAQAIIERWGLQ